ncbi:MAG: Na+/H+ antiporter [Acidobacteriaceae bacterium]|nr:Na+/H+ antiporter [Acidobacteriaceae bacterium]
MESTHSTENLQLLSLFLLVAVALFAGLARRLRVPYPILLVVGGLLLSLIPRMPQVPLKPDLVFTIFLPPLLYAAAWQTNWRDFKRNLLPISMLAIGLVGFTVLGVAFFADRFIPELDFRSGFLLGAVVAATDAIAATSIASSLGLAPRTVAILSGESLVNDATALLALELGLALLLGQKVPTVGEGALRLLWLMAGGAGCGLLLGKVVVVVERWVDESALEMVLSLVVPYVAYLAAEQMHASGVIAVVACGLYLSRKSVQYLTAQARLEILAGWHALDFILNGVVFLLIGLQLREILQGIRHDSFGTLVEYAVGFTALLVALRMLWVFAGGWVSYWIREYVLKHKSPTPSNKDIFIIGWAGMRGVVALAAAYSLPASEEFPQRNLIIFLTFAVILITLVGQGLSLPALIRKLKLSGDREGELEELDARCRLLSAAIRELGARMETAGETEQHDLEDVLHRYEHRREALNARQRHLRSTEPLEADDEDLRHAWRAQLARETVAIERAELLKLRNEGWVGDDVLRVLQRELDLSETRYANREFRA